MRKSARPVCRLLAVSLAFGAVWLGRAPLALAQNPLGGEFQINTTLGPRTYVPAVARRPAGEFVVVWEGRRSYSDRELYGQAYDATGSPAGGEFPVSPGRDPAIAYSPDGTFSVVYMNGPRHIDGRRFSPSGTPIGSEFEVSNFWPSRYPPDVASVSDSSFVVVWDEPDTSNIGVFARLFDGSGTPSTGKFRVNQEAFSIQGGQDVASLPSGGFIVTWRGLGRQGSSFVEGIFGRLYDSSGTPISDDFVVTTGGAYADVAANDRGEFVVVWERSGIRGRRYDASGRPLGSEFTVVADQGRSVRPSIASSGEGDFVVSWRRVGSGQVFAREFAADGTPRTGSFQVSTTYVGRHPAVASNHKGDYVVVWDAGYLILGQHFAGPNLHLSVEGSCPGAATVSILNAPPNSEVAVIAAENTNGFIKTGTLCAGVELEVGEPFQLPPTWITVDENGSGSAGIVLDDNRCRLEALATSSCETSGAVHRP